MSTLSIETIRRLYPGHSDVQATQAYAKEHGCLAIVRYRCSETAEHYTDIGTCETDEEVRAYLRSPFCHDAEVVYDRRTSATPEHTEKENCVIPTHRLDEALAVPEHAGKCGPFENVPTEGRTFVEAQEHGLRMRGAPAGATIRQVISFEELARSVGGLDACNFYVLDGVTHAVFRMAATRQSGWVAAISDSVGEGKALMDCVFRAMPTFPILGLMFKFPTARRMQYYEAIPTITNADVKESLINLCENGFGKILLFLDPPCRLMAQGLFHLKSPEEFRRCLDQAARHYFQLPPTSLNFALAANRYRETVPMPDDE